MNSFSHDEKAGAGVAAERLSNSKARQLTKKGQLVKYRDSTNYDPGKVTWC